MFGPLVSARALVDRRVHLVWSDSRGVWDNAVPGWTLRSAAAFTVCRVDDHRVDGGGVWRFDQHPVSVGKVVKCLSRLGAVADDEATVGEGASVGTNTVGGGGGDKLVAWEEVVVRVAGFWHAFVVGRDASLDELAALMFFFFFFFKTKDKEEGGKDVM